MTHRSVIATSNTEPVNLRLGATSQARVIDSIIPVVLRRAERAALLRDDRLEIAVDPAGQVKARIVKGAR